MTSNTMRTKSPKGLHSRAAYTPARDRGQQQLIDQARALLKPTPVELHKVPSWLRRKLLATFGWENRHLRGGVDVLERAVKLHCDNRKWLAHYGGTFIDGHEAFVSEPFGLTPEGLKSIQQFAAQLGLRWHVDGNSWWHPGRTIRITFPNPEADATPEARDE